MFPTLHDRVQRAEAQWQDQCPNSPPGGTRDSSGQSGVGQPWRNLAIGEDRFDDRLAPVKQGGTLKDSLGARLPEDLLVNDTPHCSRDVVVVLGFDKERGVSSHLGQRRYV